MKPSAYAYVRIPHPLVNRTTEQAQLQTIRKIYSEMHGYRWAGAYIEDALPPRTHPKDRPCAKKILQKLKKNDCILVSDPGILVGTRTQTHFLLAQLAATQSLLYTSSPDFTTPLNFALDLFQGLQLAAREQREIDDLYKPSPGFKLDRNGQLTPDLELWQLRRDAASLNYNQISLPKLEKLSPNAQPISAHIKAFRKAQRLAELTPLLQAKLPPHYTQLLNLDVVNTPLPRLNVRNAQKLLRQVQERLTRERKKA